MYVSGSLWGLVQAGYRLVSLVAARNCSKMAMQLKRQPGTPLLFPYVAKTIYFPRETTYSIRKFDIIDFNKWLI